MRLRVVIFEDNDGIRQGLRALCEGRGHEVFAFPEPGLCPLHVMERCPCAPGIICADIIFSDLNMPGVQGLDFIEGLMAKHCVVPHLVLMSAEWTEADEARPVRLGCRLFHKPFSLAELDAWLAKIEPLVPPDRGLLLWDSFAWQRSVSALGAIHSSVQDLPA